MTGGRNGGIAAIRGLDHVLVGVRDLEAARRVWQRLGFTLSPRGRHIGWGTANYCIMFPGDYVELLGIVDPSRFVNRLDRFLEVREGLLGVALASGDAEAAAAQLAESGIAAEGPKDLVRTLDLPGGEVRPAFRLVHLPPSATPGLSAFVCQHRTRELVWNADWLDHPNGARSLRALTAVVDDPGDLACAYRRLFGAGRVSAGESGLLGGLQVDTGATLLRFTTPGRLANLHPLAAGLPAYPTPWLAALTLGVADPEQTAACLAEAGVAARSEAAGRLLVPPAEATGVVLEFAARNSPHR